MLFLDVVDYGKKKETFTLGAEETRGGTITALAVGGRKSSRQSDFFLKRIWWRDLPSKTDLGRALCLFLPHLFCLDLHPFSNVPHTLVS